MATIFSTSLEGQSKYEHEHHGLEAAGGDETVIMLPL